MNHKKPVVKYNNQFWIMEKEVNGMAQLWRNGQPALVPVSEIERIRAYE